MFVLLTLPEHRDLADKGFWAYGILLKPMPQQFCEGAYGVHILQEGAVILASI